MYGASFAQDSLINYIQQSLGKQLPQYKRIGFEITDTARESDDDFENSLNLFFDAGQTQYAYPKFEMVASTTKNYRPKVIIIGDSFFWQIKSQKILQHVFSEDSKFWFYFAGNACSLGDGPDIPLNKETDVMKELQSADYVILFCNIGTLNSFPYGITDFYLDHATSSELTRIITEYLKNNSLRTIKLSNNNAVNSSLPLEVDKIFNTKKIIQLKAANNKYFCADESNKDALLINRDDASTWETFSLLNLDSNHVAIYSFKNRFLSIDLNNKTEITVTQNYIDKYEIFTMINYADNMVAFKAANGKYLSFDEKSYHVFGNSNTIGKNEKFKLLIKN